jgi:hypothetical protein
VIVSTVVEDTPVLYIGQAGTRNGVQEGAPLGLHWSSPIA